MKKYVCRYTSKEICEDKTEAELQEYAEMLMGIEERFEHFSVQETGG